MEGILSEIEGRRATRGYSVEALPPGALERLAEAARLAPSCNNKQPWRLALADAEPLLSGMRESLAPGNAWARKAPLLVAVLTKPELGCRLDGGRGYAGGRDYAGFDCGAATMALLLQARKEGLVAHPMAGFFPDKLREALGAGADWLPLVLIAVGKPGPAEGLEPWQLERETGPRKREPFEANASVNAWNFG